MNIPFTSYIFMILEYSHEKKKMINHTILNTKIFLKKSGSLKGYFSR